MAEVLALLTDFTLRNVMLGAALLGIVSRVLGSFALLRQQSLLGDTLSHAALPGVALGFLVAGGRQLVPILLGALLTGALAALFMVLLVRRSRLKTDAALGAALSIFFAFGIVLLTYIGNQNNAGQAGLEAFLFGQAASIIPSDVVTMAVIAGLALGIVLLFWKEFKVVSFDPGVCREFGLPGAGTRADHDRDGRAGNSYRLADGRGGADGVNDRRACGGGAAGGARGSSRWSCWQPCSGR